MSCFIRNWHMSHWKWIYIHNDSLISRDSVSRYVCESRPLGIENMMKLIDAKRFYIFLCLHWNKIIFSSLFTRSKNGGEIELQEGTPEVQYNIRSASYPYVKHLMGVKRPSYSICLCTYLAHISGDSVPFITNVTNSKSMFLSNQRGISLVLFNVCCERNVA